MMKYFILAIFFTFACGSYSSDDISSSKSEIKWENQTTIVSQDESQKKSENGDILALIHSVVHEFELDNFITTFDLNITLKQLKKKCNAVTKCGWPKYAEVSVALGEAAEYLAEDLADTVKTLKNVDDCTWDKLIYENCLRSPPFFKSLKNIGFMSYLSCYKHGKVPSKKQLEKSDVDFTILYCEDIKKRAIKKVKEAKNETY